MIQRQLSDGMMWSDETGERETMFVEMAARHNRSTVEEIRERLEQGKSVQYDTDWYAQIRFKAKQQPKPEPVEKFFCGCGHIIDKRLVMNTSSGTSCPDCYDRMSD